MSCLLYYFNIVCFSLPSEVSLAIVNWTLPPHPARCWFLHNPFLSYVSPKLLATADWMLEKRQCNMLTLVHRKLIMLIMCSLLSQWRCKKSIHHQKGWATFVAWHYATFHIYVDCKIWTKVIEFCGFLGGFYHLFLWWQQGRKFLCLFRDSWDEHRTGQLPYGKRHHHRGLGCFPATIQNWFNCLII